MPPTGSGSVSLKKDGVFHLQHREIAVVADVFDLGDVLPGIVLLFQREEARIADHVRVGHHVIGIHHPARTRAAAHLRPAARGCDNLAPAPYWKSGRGFCE